MPTPFTPSKLLRPSIMVGFMLTLFWLVDTGTCERIVPSTQRANPWGLPAIPIASVRANHDDDDCTPPERCDSIREVQQHNHFDDVDDDEEDDTRVEFAFLRPDAPRETQARLRETDFSFAQKASAQQWECYPCANNQVRQQPESCFSHAINLLDT